MPDAGRPHIDVCVCTYKRPESLARLLRSLISQETAGRFTYSIHVADNDANGTAEPVVRGFGPALSYGIEPVQNIALARNLSVSFARGDWIATVDDDVVAEPDWLLRLFDAAEKYGADAVCGPAIPVFLPDAADYVREFNRLYDPESGSERGFVAATSNFLFRRALVDGNPAPFDRRFGRTGGSDTDLVYRFRKSGARVVWCREAVVHSPVSAERSTLGWILWRRFRYGYTTGDIDRVPFTPRIFGYLLWSAAKNAARAGLWSIRSIADRNALSRARLFGFRSLLYFVYLCGRVARAANIRFEEYRA